MFGQQLHWQRMWKIWSRAKLSPLTHRLRVIEHVLQAERMKVCNIAYVIICIYASYCHTDNLLSINYQSNQMTQSQLRNLKLAVKQLTRLFAKLPQEIRQTLIEDMEESKLSAIDGEKLELARAAQNAFNFVVSQYSDADPSQRSSSQLESILDEMAVECQSPNSKTKQDKAFNDDVVDNKAVKQFTKGTTEILNAVKVTLGGLDTAITEFQEERDLTKHS